MRKMRRTKNCLLSTGFAPRKIILIGFGVEISIMSHERVVVLTEIPANVGHSSRSFLCHIAEEWASHVTRDTDWTELTVNCLLTRMDLGHRKDKSKWEHQQAFFPMSLLEHACGTCRLYRMLIDFSAGEPAKYSPAVKQQLQESWIRSTVICKYPFLKLFIMIFPVMPIYIVL